MAAVVDLRAQDAHASLVAPAEQLQEPLVSVAQPLLQRGHRFYQRVDLQGGNSQVRLQVALTVRRQTHGARLEGPTSFLLGAHVTVHLAPLSSSSDLLRHLPRESVFTKLRAAVEHRPTPWTAGGSTAVPQRRDAFEAEAVTAGDGHGVRENILTDAALKLDL